MGRFDSGVVVKSQNFHASWRSGFGLAAVICGMFVGLFLCMLLNPAARRGPAAGCLVLFGVGLAVMVAQVASRRPVLSVGPHGIGGRGLRGHTIHWHEIEEVRHERVGGNDRLVMTLTGGAPSLDVTRRRFNARSTQRTVLLGALGRSEMRQAIEAAHAFARESRAHA
jgi:hypothetical protein